MPHYDYLCGGCGHEFTSKQSIADRKLPTEGPCTECGKPLVDIKVGATKMVYDAGTNIRNVPDAFKDITNRIKRNYKNSTIDV